MGTGFLALRVEHNKRLLGGAGGGWLSIKACGDIGNRREGHREGLGGP